MKRFLVIGDACHDIYHFGSTRRANPESRAPLLNRITSDTKLGMAANVAENLQALGALVDTKFPPERWSEKHRYLNQHQEHLLRVDFDSRAEPLLNAPDVQKYDGVLVSDYGKGFITEELLRDLDYDNVFIDTKKINLGFLQNAWVKINEVESMRLETEPKNLVVTLGHQGARYKGILVQPEYTSSVDPCGAGDTFLAAFAFAMVDGSSVARAIEFANEAAYLTCREVGTFAPTMEEIDEVCS
jgi:D-beta-D-heptose 7-phosphate kinase/D-beta-D-heptose 1-phosphate adenosyltransferase